jgi:hypothetical protein
MIFFSYIETYSENNYRCDTYICSGVGEVTPTSVENPEHRVHKVLTFDVADT